MTSPPLHASARRERHLAEEIAKLNNVKTAKRSPRRGGPVLARSVVELDLVDDYRFVVHPAILGNWHAGIRAASKRIRLGLLEERRVLKWTVAHVYHRRL